MKALQQLDLFGGSESPSAGEPPDLDRVRALADQMPAHVRLGTSSWTFPGWAGLVYPAGTSERELMTRGLELYAKYPLFKTVGIDRSYYRPLGSGELERYREQLPPGFRCVVKVWSEITSIVDPETRQKNPHFLDADLFEREVLAPLQQHFFDHLGPLVFELMPLRRSELPEPAELRKMLASFFARVPKEFQYAVELRNRELLSEQHLETLAEHGVAHVLNFWERMPTLGEQLSLPGILTAPFAVARLMIPPGERYATRREQVAPFDQIVEPQPQMRADVVSLSDACGALGKVLFVVVNNKAEGSSPLTVRAIAERLVERGAP